jgi:hypothetical protein
MLRNAFLIIFASLPALRAADAGGDGDAREVAYSWEISGQYPHTGIAPVDERIKAWVTDAVKASMAEASESYGPDFGQEGRKQSYRTRLEHGVSRPGPGAVSVAFFRHSFQSLQAHPMTAVATVNLRNDGTELSLDDLFDDPDLALQILAREAEAYIRRETKRAHPGYFDGDGSVFFEDGFEPTRENYATLALEPDGARVYFQLYQVLPYALGIPEAPVALDKLAPAGPNREIWPNAVRG